MKTLVRNRKKFYYALYEDEQELVDSKGFKTGEKGVGYSTPKSMMANISPATGNSNTEQFGNLDSYDKVIVTHNMDCPINEDSILWVDSLDTDKPHDYVVKRVSVSKNVIAIAIAKVKVS